MRQIGESSKSLAPSFLKDIRPRNDRDPFLPTLYEPPAMVDRPSFACAPLLLPPDLFLYFSRVSIWSVQHWHETLFPIGIVHRSSLRATGSEKCSTGGTLSPFGSVDAPH
jgi:hypothetical protein